MGKQCNKCKKEKDVDKFGDLKSAKDGKNPTCKECRNLYAKNKNFKKPEKEIMVVCTGCHQEKSSLEYYGSHSNTNGLQSRCIECQRKQQHDYKSTFNGFMNKLMLSVDSNAKKRSKKEEREIRVEITKQDVIDLYYEQNGKCNLTDIDLTYSADETDFNISVDRVDSDGHYTPDNIQLVCNIVNKMKWDLNQDDFLFFCRKIVEYNA